MSLSILLSTTPSNQKIGVGVRLARQRAGLTQRQLGAQIRRSHVAVSDIERGNSSLSLSLALQICVACNVGLQELYDPITEEEVEAEVDDLLERVITSKGVITEQLMYYGELVDDTESAWRIHRLRQLAWQTIAGRVDDEGRYPGDA